MLSIYSAARVDIGIDAGVGVFRARARGSRSVNPTSHTPARVERLEGRTLLHSATLYIDSGGGPYTDSYTGIIYAKDFGFTGGQSGTQTFSVANTIRDPLYVTRRWGNFSYNLPIENGAYTLKLLFVEPVWTSAGKRKFDVFAEGKQILNDLDIYASAGAKTAMTRTFTVN